MDLSYAYRFGPCSYDVLRASFVDQHAQSCEAFYFPLGLPNSQTDVRLSASARRLEDGLEIDIACQGFAQSVHIEAPGYVADDQYFHMAPRSRRTLRLTSRARGREQPFEGTVYALNSAAACRVEWPA